MFLLSVYFLSFDGYLFSLNTSAQQCFKQKIFFLSAREQGCRTWPCKYNLTAPYYKTDFGNRTFSYNAVALSVVKALLSVGACSYTELFHKKR